MQRAAALMALLLVVSGCASKPAEPASLPQDQGPSYQPPVVDDTAGAIDGLVVTDEHAPLANATVGLGADGPKTSSDAAGRFSFSKVAPGAHVLFAAALGFGAGAVRVDVVAGRTSSATLVLEPLPTNEARQETIVLRGKTTCTVSYRSSVNYLRPTCSLASAAFPNDKWNIQYDLKQGFVDVLVETTWQPTYAFGDQLLQIVRPLPFSQTENIREFEGRGPIRILVNQTEWGAWDVKYKTNYTGAGGKLSLSTFAAHNLVGPPSPVQVGAVFDQSFTVYSTSSFNGPMPPTFTAVRDS